MRTGDRRSRVPEGGLVVLQPLPMVLQPPPSSTLHSPEFVPRAPLVTL
jgi:hypothetical protein